MEDTTISIIAIIIGAIIMFMVPLMVIADRADDIAQLTAQTATSEFVDTVIKSGKITSDQYNDYLSLLTTTGNTYEIDMELKILDENASKRYTVIDQPGKIGENKYYSIYTSQIEEKLLNSDIDDDGNENNSGVIVLKEGDVIAITAKNSSKTLSQSLKNTYYKIRGEELHIIAATASGTIAINGAT